MTGKQIVDEYRGKGFDDNSIADFLLDGAALAAEGFTDDDQEAVEDAYQIVSRRAAARALGSVKSEKKAASSRENGKKGGRPKTMKYRVDVDFIDHGESNYFGNKADAFAFARGLDWETSVFKDFGEQYGWQMIGKKDRYSMRVNTVAF